MNVPGNREEVTGSPAPSQRKEFSVTRRNLLFSAATASLIAVMITMLIGEDAAGRPQAEAPSPEKMQEMMQKWLATTSPGEQHKRLEAFVGSWKTKTRMWWAGPQGPATESEGTSEIQWILGKRFIREEVKSVFPLPDKSGGMKKIPFEGIGLMGYDNYRKMYVGTWVDTMNTTILSMRGNADPSGKVITTYGTMDEPMLGVIGRTVKYVSRVVDKNTCRFVMYDLHAGDDYKVMEIAYTRK